MGRDLAPGACCRPGSVSGRRGFQPYSQSIARNTEKVSNLDKDDVQRLPNDPGFQDAPGTLFGARTALERWSPQDSVRDESMDPSSNGKLD